MAFCHFSRGAVDVSCDFVVRRGNLDPLRTARVLLVALAVSEEPDIQIRD